MCSAEAAQAAQGLASKQQSYWSGVRLYHAMCRDRSHARTPASMQFKTFLDGRANSSQYKVKRLMWTSLAASHRGIH